MSGAVRRAGIRGRRRLLPFRLPVGTWPRVTVVAFLLGCLLAPATGRPATTGLVAAFSFNEGSGSTVGDASGSGNNGAVGSATWSASGKFGAALSFNGSSAEVTVPDAASLHLTSAMTLEAWVRPSVVSDLWRGRVGKGNGD